MPKVIVNYTNKLKSVKVDRHDLDISAVKDKSIGDWFMASPGWNGLTAEIEGLLDCNYNDYDFDELDFNFNFYGNEEDTAVFDKCLKDRGFLEGIGYNKAPKGKIAADEAEILKEAAEQGDAKSQYYLGKYYSQKGSYEENLEVYDPNKAKEWYKKAAEQDYAPAMLALGEDYCSNFDFNKGHVLIEKAAEQNYVPALYSFGQYCNYCDLDNSLYWFKKAAEQGFKKAQDTISALNKREAEHQEAKPHLKRTYM